METNLLDKIRYEKMFAKYLECLKKDLDNDSKCKKVIVDFHEIFSKSSDSETTIQESQKE